MNDPAKPVLLEICLASVEDALAAEQGGADRLELNAALSLGGLTPSLGTLEEVMKATRLPLLAMVRPRPGGFAYRDSEFRILQRDLDLVLANGANGAVVGILTEEGKIDGERCRKIRRQASGRPLVFHRAFDLLKDPWEGLEILIDLGFQRILTSGQAESALQGSARLRELIERAQGRIEILPAAGIRPTNVLDLIQRTRCRQVHASLRTSGKDGEEITDALAVQEMARVIQP